MQTTYFLFLSRMLSSKKIKNKLLFAQFEKEKENP
jgi:hypothetical protein